MMVVQILLAFFWMCVLPFLTGCILTKPLCQKGKWNVFYLTGLGLLMQYALYEVLALLFIVLDRSFRLLSKLYAGTGLLLAAGGALALFLHRKALLAYVKESRAKAKREKGEQNTRMPDIWLLAGILLIAVQLAAILFWATPDSDDAFYSGLSSMSLAGDYVLKYDAYNGQMKVAISNRYAISALPVYQASLQLLCADLHHLFITHNLFPLFYIPLAYGLFYLVAGVFASEDRAKRHRFLFFFALLHLFGNTFVFSPQNFLVTRIWQGKALFICISLPVSFLLVHGIFAQEKLRQRILSGLWLLPVLLGTVFMGETGLFLLPLMLAALVLAHGYCIKTDENRKDRL
ncbi:MAG: hypothetical protein IJ711_08380 [Lachnospiraceae bacterium]|nr:hypothetical protein [Lachnospiraceae bacterium]